MDSIPILQKIGICNHVFDKSRQKKKVDCQSTNFAKVNFFIKFSCEHALFQIPWHMLISESEDSLEASMAQLHIFII
jgi:hypothetical protein